MSRALRWAPWLAALLVAAYLGYVALRGSDMLVRPRIRPFIPDVEGAPVTPADLGMAYEDVTFRTDDGLRLAGWLIPAARETRATVILLHGFSGHRLPELAAFVPWLQREYHVLQFDFRGHGASEGSPVTLGAAERHDVAAAVRFCEERGLGPIALYGVSMGASVAILSAPDLPVVAVVADAPYADVHHPIASRLRELGYPLATLAARGIVAGASLRVRSRLLGPFGAVGRIAPRGLLLIAPREDALIAWTQSVRLYEAALEPKELMVVPGAAHAEAHAVAGARYERRVLDFLSLYLDAPGSPSAAPSV